MHEGKFIIALDQGTTSSRAVLFNAHGELLAIEQQEFSQIFPKSGWVEHDPEEIWESQQNVLKKLIRDHVTDIKDIVAFGITNQRETTVVWDKHTGKAVYNAIVWQDTRTAKECRKLANDGHEEYIRENTGLIIDSYFSGTKIMWILDHVEGARAKAEKGDLLFGTIDTWLVWKLTEGKVHATDLTNASRTMIFNIRTREWDQHLLDALNIPAAMLPEVKFSAANFGNYTYRGMDIPITGIAGDQQAALFGQQCFEAGMVKNTYGTGCFMLMNIGESMRLSQNNLITTIGIGLENEVAYAIEGSIFIAGAAIQWLRDGLKIIERASDSQKLAWDIKDNYEVIMVPAFAGLGAPYWDMSARGAIFGLTRDSTDKHIIKATLESMAYQTRDVIIAMEKDAGNELLALKVDGGAVANDYLMQFQADILQVPVERPEIIESTAQGAAYLAGIGCGLWTRNDLKKFRKLNAIFEPEMSKDQSLTLYKRWNKAVKRTMNWMEDEGND